MKLWGGRFTGETDQLVNQLNASLQFDYRLYPFDIAGSVTHVQMLVSTGILSQIEGEMITGGLTDVKTALDQGEIDPAESSCEDIHSLVEEELIKRIGPVGGKMHMARSRNDQVALDMRLYLRQEVEEIKELLSGLMEVLLEQEDRSTQVIMPGYTHLQRAQPVTFAHHLLAYYFKFKRDYQRFSDNLKRINILPLGSGALAGTTFPIDRKFTAEQLGFDSICQNSIDGVSDRDFIIEFLSVASTLIMHLSRLSEEIVLFSSSEFAFIELDDAYATGSSIMPQKKNPDIAELTRGKAGRVYGHLLQILTVMKGLPLAYNKDMQEDKEGIFDTVDNLKLILRVYPGMLATMQVNSDRMRRSAGAGQLNATDLADYLAEQGLPFRQAHEIVGRAVLYALENDIELEQISLADWKDLFPGQADLFTGELYHKLKIENCVSERKSSGGTSPSGDMIIIEQEQQWLSTRVMRK